MQFSESQQNLLYLYDLPKDTVDSKKLAMIFKEQAGITLDTRPQIKRDVTRPFYTGIVLIKDPLEYEKACDKMRYFYVDGK